MKAGHENSKEPASLQTRTAEPLQGNQPLGHLLTPVMHAALRLCAFLCVAHTISARILWVGSVNATSATVSSELLAGETAATLVLATNPSLSSVVASTPITAIGTATKLVASGLTPRTLYYYGIPGAFRCRLCACWPFALLSFRTLSVAAFSCNWFLLLTVV